MRVSASSRCSVETNSSFIPSAIFADSSSTLRSSACIPGSPPPDTVGSRLRSPARIVRIRSCDVPSFSSSGRTSPSVSSTNAARRWSEVISGLPASIARSRAPATASCPLTVSFSNRNAIVLLLSISRCRGVPRDRRRSPRVDRLQCLCRTAAIERDSQRSVAREHVAADVPSIFFLSCVARAPFAEAGPGAQYAGETKRARRESLPDGLVAVRHSRPHAAARAQSFFTSNSASIASSSPAFEAAPAAPPSAPWPAFS